MKGITDDIFDIFNARIKGGEMNDITYKGKSLIKATEKRDRAKAFKQLHIDDMYGMIKRLEKRVEELEYERWKRNLQEDHVRYDFIGDNNEDDS